MRAEPQKLVDSIKEALGLLRRHEPVRPRCIGAIRHTQEIIDPAKNVSSHLPVLGIRDGDVVADEQQLALVTIGPCDFRRRGHPRCAHGNPG